MHTKEEWRTRNVPKLAVRRHDSPELPNPMCEGEQKGEPGNSRTGPKRYLEPEEIDRRKKMMHEFIKNKRYADALLECKKAAGEINLRMGDRGLFNEAKDCVVAAIRKGDFRTEAIEETEKNAGDAWMLKAYLEAHSGNYKAAVNSYGIAIERYMWNSEGYFMEQANAADTEAMEVARAHLGREEVLKLKDKIRFCICNPGARWKPDGEN
ncbi:MAG: hypothetical protein WC488_01385 [Candidatus Micrarchaeia archaeon]